MDEEDLADAEEARKIQTSQAFAGLGLTDDDASRAATRGGALAGLFQVSGETMGTKLLKKMGWKEGQGIGPKVRRIARLDVGRPNGRTTAYLFAPEDVGLVHLIKKADHKGLGFAGAARLGSAAAAAARDDLDNDESDKNEDDDTGITRGLFSRPTPLGGVQKGRAARSGGIGLGVLNDTGSDDEDPYDMGPRISFNRVIGGDKKKKKKNAKSKSADGVGGESTGESSAASRPKIVFSATSILGRGKSGASSARLCHDGRPPLSGFVLARKPDALTSDTGTASKFPPPVIPPGWKSSKTPRGGSAAAQQADGRYVSVADAAKASKLDPRARAAVLGESQLPGKSVFDFLSPEARDRIAAATGRRDLPEARGEIPAAYALTEQERRDQLLQAVPALDKATAVAAITRGARGGGPYQDDETKRSRYRAYLEFQAGIASGLPPKPAGMKDDDWLREFHEFLNCARIFKPMSGLMASRFTTSTSSGGQSMSGPSSSNKAAGDDQSNLVTRPAPKPQDPAEEAAKMGMYGPMTRTVGEFFPTRLLCKRLGVKPPAVVQPDEDMGTGPAGASSWSSSGASRPTFGGSGAAAASAPAYAEPGTADTAPDAPGRQNPAAAPPQAQAQPDVSASVTVQADRNEALEGQRAGEDVFRAVFGDSDEDG